MTDAFEVRVTYHAMPCSWCNAVRRMGVPNDASKALLRDGFTHLVNEHGGALCGVDVGRQEQG